jgi:16S rRNA processing protein RimM
LSADRPVVLAAISGAHGIAGEVRLKLFAEGVAALKRYRAFNDGKLTVLALRDDGKGGAIARFAESTDRNTAEKLRGTALSVSRSSLPPLAPGEYYHADVIGLPAVSASGEALGTVIAVENFGAGDVLEIERVGEDGRKHRFMVPMRAEAVPEWDEARLVVADGWAEG